MSRPAEQQVRQVLDHRPGAGADPNATYNADDVVDADYKEV